MADKDSRPRGDCFRACLASVLERELDEVPHFVELEEQVGYYFVDLTNNWLRKQGYPFQVLYRNVRDGQQPIRYYVKRRRQWRESGYGHGLGYWLMGVLSKNFKGSHHVVVAHEDAVVWDPSPNFGKPEYDRRPYVFDGWAYTFHVPDAAKVPRVQR